MSTPEDFQKAQDAIAEATHIPIAEHLLVTQALRTENARLRYAAEHDELTGLYNPTAWRQQVRSLVEQDVTTGVILFDLDRFKAVNDYLGHSVGDGLIAAFGERLTNRIRPGAVAGRIGGDEFGIAIDLDARDDGLSGPYILMDEAYYRAQAESALFVAERNPEIRRLGFGVSIGAALSSPRQRLSFATLMEQADEDLRDAKPFYAR